MDAATGSAQRAHERPRSARATPLSPPERRAAIIAAAIPLIRSQGLAVTIRQIADAAGVAEGTIFHVFPDKEALITASLEAAVDPGPTVERLRAIDGSLPFEDRLVEAVRILQAHVAEVWKLVLALGPDGKPHRAVSARGKVAAGYVAALEPLFAPAGALRQKPSAAARALLAITVGCSHPSVVDRPMTPEQIVDLLLDGVRGSAR